MNSNDLLLNNIQNMIFTFNDKQVMVDKDLADLYGVTTKRLNEQVKRNINRFPDNFRFQLTNNQKNELVANCDRLKKLKHSTVNPYVFTEQGVAMLSAVLHSKTAIDVSIKIMEAFIEMRRFLFNNASIFQKFEKIEQKLLENDKKFTLIFEAIENKSIKPQQGIFYDGQIFDAYEFVSKLIKSANKTIVLIDNYIDETVLTLFKKNKTADIVIYTKKISNQLKLDLSKYNSQYNTIKIKQFNSAHDRFLIIDNKDVYHFGASFKDLGKKWFAFSKFKIDAFDLLRKL